MTSTSLKQTPTEPPTSSSTWLPSKTPEKPISIPHPFTTVESTSTHGSPTSIRSTRSSPISQSITVSPSQPSSTPSVLTSETTRLRSSSSTTSTMASTSASQSTAQTSVPSDSTTNTLESTTDMTNAMIKAKIKKMKRMTSSINTVINNIDDVTSVRSGSVRSGSLHCSEFVDLVTLFESICHDISQLLTIESLEAEIDSSLVHSCNSTHLSSLSSLKISKLAKKENLEVLIKIHQAMLSYSSTLFTTSKRKKITFMHTVSWH